MVGRRGGRSYNSSGRLAGRKVTMAKRKAEKTYVLWQACLAAGLTLLCGTLLGLLTAVVWTLAPYLASSLPRPLWRLGGSLVGLGLKIKQCC